MLLKFLHPSFQIIFFNLQPIQWSRTTLTPFYGWFILFSVINLFCFFKCAFFFLSNNKIIFKLQFSSMFFLIIKCLLIFLNNNGCNFLRSSLLLNWRATTCSVKSYRLYFFKGFSFLLQLSIVWLSIWAAFLLFENIYFFLCCIWFKVVLKLVKFWLDDVMKKKRKKRGEKESNKL